MTWLKAVGRYVMRVLIGVDQLGNTLIGGASDETISARAGRLREKNPVAAATCTVLDVIDKDHCDTAIESERTQRHQDRAYREPR